MLYLAYRKAAPARKDDDDEEAALSGDDDEEDEGLAAHLMGGQVEMMAQRGGGRLRLHKGLSLPMPPSGAPLSVVSSPRNGFAGSIIKSLSATPSELHSVLYQHGHRRFEAVKKDDDDVEAN